MQLKVDLLETRQKLIESRLPTSQQTDTKIDDNIALIDELLEEVDSGLLDGLTGLVGLIKEHFSLDEIDELAYGLGIEPEDLPGQTRSKRARELVEYARRNGDLPSLVGACMIRRQQIIWPQVGIDFE